MAARGIHFLQSDSERRRQDRRAYPHSRLDTLLEMSAAFQVMSHQMPDHHEAVAAFNDKRKPEFLG